MEIELQNGAPHEGRRMQKIAADRGSDEKRAVAGTVNALLVSHYAWAAFKDLKE